MIMAEPETSAVTTCWSCRGPATAREPFCPTCGAVQPPAALDAFARLGLKRGFDIDSAQLERRYFDLQRRLHPDRFAAKSPRERALSQQQAAALNQAYETLKDPLARAAALLRAAGREAKFEGEGTIADPALLTEAMELRETLAEAESRADVERFAADSRTQVDNARAALAGAFAAGNLDGAEALALRLRYLTKLADEAQARLRAVR